MREQLIAILGASNLANAYSSIVRGFAELHETRSTLAIAGGHGRSFGDWSSVLHRALPGILECGVWPFLEEHHTQRRLAVVTDVGNDLIYGESVPQILQWVDHTLDRLRAAGFAVVLTLPPMSGLRKITRFRFEVFRRFFFPGSPLRFDAAKSQLEELTTGLVQIGDRHQATIVEPASEWYGFDPIHIRFSQRPAAWKTILSAAGAGIIPPHLPRFGVVPFRPERGIYWGRERRNPQPSLRLKSATVAVF